MPKITKIEAQKKTAGRYSVYLDDKYSLSFSDNALLESKIYVGQLIDEQALSELKNKSELDKFYMKSLNLISLRPRSEYEIKSYLKRKDCPTSKIESILNKLREYKYIDDQAFANAWVNSRLLLKSLSKNRLKNELRKKGVNNLHIQSALDDINIDDGAALSELIAKKRKISRYEDDLKLMQYLVRQGFKYEDIKKAFNN
jgi:regulatory protein